MEENIYYMKDTFDPDNDCSFYVKTNCPIWTLEEIIDSVDLIRDVYMGSIDKSDLAGYNLKYLKYVDSYGGEGKSEFICRIVLKEGYTWEEIGIPVVEW